MQTGPRGFFSSTMVEPKLLPKVTETPGGLANSYSGQKEPVDTSRNTTSTPSPVETTKTTDIILQSWRQSTQKQYDTHLWKWILFSSARKIDPIHTNVTDAVEFLASMYDQNLSYSSINSAHSALQYKICLEKTTILSLILF